MLIHFAGLIDDNIRKLEKDLQHAATVQDQSDDLRRRFLVIESALQIWRQVKEFYQRDAMQNNRLYVVVSDPRNEKDFIISMFTGIQQGVSVYEGRHVCDRAAAIKEARRLKDTWNQSGPAMKPEKE